MLKPQNLEKKLSHKMSSTVIGTLTATTGACTWGCSGLYLTDPEGKTLVWLMNESKNDQNGLLAGRVELETQGSSVNGLKGQAVHAMLWLHVPID